MTICVVTGAGSGLGRALAVELTSQNVRVVGLGRRESALAETQGLAAPDLFTPIPVDISDIDAVNAAFDDIAAKVGRVDILINNAAVYPHRDILEIPADAFMQTIRTNLGGVLACAMAALRGMVEAGEGRILNVGTFADLKPIPASAEYSVSKGAVKILTRALVADIADRFPHIVINDWVPGVLATEMGLAHGLDPAVAARWGARLAMSRDPSLSGTVWEMDHEIPRPRSLKRQLLDMATLRGRPKARHVDQI